MSYVNAVAGLVLVLLAAFGVYSFVQAHERSAEIDRLESARDSLEVRVDFWRDSVARVDSIYRVDSVYRVRVRERADTVFTASVDTIRAALPDSLRGVLDNLVRADSIEDAAYEAEIAQLHARIRARDRALASRDSLIAVQDTLIEKLKQPDPLTIDLPFGLEASPGVGLGMDRDGRPNIVAGAVIQ